MSSNTSHLHSVSPVSYSPTKHTGHCSNKGRSQHTDALIIKIKQQRTKKKNPKRLIFISCFSPTSCTNDKGGHVWRLQVILSEVNETVAATEQETAEGVTKSMSAAGSREKSPQSPINISKATETEREPHNDKVCQNTVTRSVRSKRLRGRMGGWGRPCI